MTRDVQSPTLDASGTETHPAFGMISAVRQTCTPGSVLFDSDLRHNHTISVLITRATRSRDLKHDWIHPREELIEIEMSEAQWAAFVSSVGTRGVPVTIRRDAEHVRVPELPYEPRLGVSIQETHSAAQEAFARIQAAQVHVDSLAKTGTAKEKRQAADALRSAINSATSNVDYASKQLVRHAENVVQKARADVEAMAAQHVDRLAVEGSSAPVALPEIGA